MCSYSKVLDDSTCLPFGVPLLDVRSFVTYILSPCQPELQLDAIIVVEVRLEGDNGHSGLFGPLLPLAAFGLVHQQRPDTEFFVLKVGTRHGVLSNVAVHQDGRPTVLVDFDERILQVHFAVANGLDFGAFQGNAGLERFDNFVLESSTAIDTNGPGLDLFLFGSRFGEQSCVE